MKIILDEAEILKTRWPNRTPEYKKQMEYVRPILMDVSDNGDQAIQKYTEKFDKVRIDNFEVTRVEIENAYNNVEPAQVRAIEESRKRLELVESKRLYQNKYSIEIKGVTISCTLKPLQLIGCYVPGGIAFYPSTVVMNVTPAKVAGVEKVIVCTPPNLNGSVDPLTLVACDICMVDEVYKIGGAQAIAAMAYGTETVPKVDKIVGPGNQYVTAAKTIVSEIVAIDKPAGPSEILIIADDTADPQLVAIDLISQAEHGSGGISGLVTSSKRIKDEVTKLVNQWTLSCDGDEMSAENLTERGFIYEVPKISKAIDFTNQFAPEHLEIMTKKPEVIAEKIVNSGLILLGKYTPVSSSDYCMGVNHVLPTEGYAKISSGLTILDYTKPVSIVKALKSSLGLAKDTIITLAKAEKLPNHQKAVEARFK
jgi:histidinol dehydrogenase